MDTTTAAQTVGANVSEAIRRAGETPNSIATKTGLPRTTLNRNLNGLGDGFPVAHLALIATTLNTAPSSFYRPIESAVN